MSSTDDADVPVDVAGEEPGGQSSGERFDTLVQAQVALRRDVDQVREDMASVVESLNELIDAQAEKRERKPVRYLFEYSTGEDRGKLWRELADFVDYLNSRYGATRQHGSNDLYIPDWWWRLPAVVEELVALMASWQEAYYSGTPNMATSALIAWHDRWYWPCMQRIFNASWGLKMDPNPTDTSAVTVEPRPHDRTAFDEFVDADVAEHTAAVDD